MGDPVLSGGSVYNPFLTSSYTNSQIPNEIMEGEDLYETRVNNTNSQNRVEMDTETGQSTATPTIEKIPQNSIDQLDHPKCSWTHTPDEVESSIGHPKLSQQQNHNEHSDLIQQSQHMNDYSSNQSNLETAHHHHQNSDLSLMRNAQQGTAQQQAHYSLTSAFARTPTAYGMAAGGYDLMSYQQQYLAAQAARSAVAQQRNLSLAANQNLVPLCPAPDYLRSAAAARYPSQSSPYSLIPTPTSTAMNQGYFDYATAMGLRSSASMGRTATAALGQSSVLTTAYSTRASPATFNNNTSTLHHANNLSSSLQQTSGNANATSMESAMPSLISRNPIVPPPATVGSPPMKRPRGRPRKHPLPISTQLQPHPQLIDDNGGNYQIFNEMMTPGYIGALTATSSGAVPSPMASSKSGKQLKLKKAARVNKYIEYRKRLYSNDVIEQLQFLEAKEPHFEVAEDFYGYGGPYTLLSVGRRIQLLQDINDEEKEQMKQQDENVPILATSSQLLQHLHASQRGFSLNTSFIWSSLNYKVPVRDLAISRHHIAALLNDSSVYIYRHKIHPLVRTMVNKWEKVEQFDGHGIVAVRIASGHLAPDWRERYHQARRPQLIQQIRNELVEKGKLPIQQSESVQSTMSSVPHQSGNSTSFIADMNHQNIGDELVSHEELEVFIAEHIDGILCVPYEYLDPDWLPDPVVLAALDQTGTVRIARCCGYYNHPSLVKLESVETSRSNSGEESLDEDKLKVDQGEMNQSDNATKQQESTQIITEVAGTEGYRQNETFQLIPKQELLEKQECRKKLLPVEKERTKTVQPTTPSMISSMYRVERRLTCMDLIEKQPEFTIPVRSYNTTGQTTIKVKAQVQDVALGELTEDSLLPSPSNSTPPEVSMVIYALGNSEHSAFVKGKNIYIRFKNFPTGPAKLHCGPLGHTGIVLLSNGTVWGWTAQSKGQENSNGKLGVVINQVGGSLKGKIVVDLMAIGAEFLALTNDGVIHEWNSYTSYLNIFTAQQCELIIPSYSTRPIIPDPIEWTPGFQKELIKWSVPSKRPYKVGSFSWFATGTNTMPQSTQVSSVTIPSYELSQHNPTISVAEVVKAPPMQRKEDTTSTTGGDDHQGDTMISLEGQRERLDNIIGVEATGFRNGILKCGGVQQLGGNIIELQQSLERCGSMDISSGQQWSMDPEKRASIEWSCASSVTVEASSRVHQKKSRCSVDSIEFESMHLWDRSDVYCEEALEHHRQQEIMRRYTNNNDLIERIFLLEGTTIIQRKLSGDYDTVSNDLLSYRFNNEIWRTLEHSFVSEFNESDGIAFIKRFGMLGKPLLTNPVIAARMKINNSNISDDALREQLEVMATQTTISYRLLLAPTSIVVGVLRKFDMTELQRTMTLARFPMLVAVDDPELTLEALTSFRPPNIVPLDNPSRKDEEAWSFSQEESSDGGLDEKINAPKRSEKIRAKRGRGRVGRPRGSRAAVRSSFSRQPTVEEPPAKRPKRAATIEEPSDEIVTVEAEAEQPLITTNNTIAASTLCLDSDVYREQTPVATAVGIRKRNRRHSSALNEDQFFTNFADSSDSDKAFEQYLQMMDEGEHGEEEDETRIKRKRGKYRKKTRDDGKEEEEEEEEMALLSKNEDEFSSEPEQQLKQQRQRDNESHLQQSLGVLRIGYDASQNEQSIYNPTTTTVVRGGIQIQGALSRYDAVEAYQG